jgi:peptidoglycan hydrolase CwlO-like protein
MKRYTVKELQEKIKTKESLIKDYLIWLDVLAKKIDTQKKTINRQKARIKVLGAALVALERDYEELKRKRK